MIHKNQIEVGLVLPLLLLTLAGTVRPMIEQEQQGRRLTALWWGSALACGQGIAASLSCRLTRAWATFSFGCWFDFVCGVLRH